MKKIILLTVAALIVSFTGCGGLKKRIVLDVEKPLFAHVIKQGEVFKVKELHDVSGDVNLKTLQLTSDAVAVKLCGAKDETGCIDDVLDAVETQVKRKAVLKTFDSVIQRRNKHVKALDEIHDKFKASYKEDGEKIKLTYLVNDLTKFYKGSKIPFEEFAYLKINELKYPQSALHEKEIHDMFPHPLEDFQANMNLLNEDLEKSYAKDIKVYNRNIRYRSSFYSVMVKNQTPKYEKFSLKIKAPTKIRRDNRNTPRVIFHITGIDMENVFPYRFEVQNSDIKFRFDHKNMRFTNLTTKDITLEHITLYYNGYNQSTLLGENFHFSGLQAKTSTSTPWRVFLKEHFKKSGFYPAMTKKKALASRVPFGIKLKYKIDGKRHMQLLQGNKKEILYHSITGW
jgi:hypothetical protein